MKRIVENRKCLNCGNEFQVKTCETKKSDKTQLFCKECSQSLTLWERRVIRMNKLPGLRDKYLQQKREEFLRSYKKNLLNMARRRAKLKGLEFNLTEDDIVIPKTCPILEVPLIVGTKDNYEYTPSLDRIDNSKGYIKGNVQVISKKANSMKNSASFAELEAFCRNVLRYSLNNRENEPIEQEDKEPLG